MISIRNIVYKWTTDEVMDILINKNLSQLWKIRALDAFGYNEKCNFTSRDKEIIKLLIEHGALPSRCSKLYKKLTMDRECDLLIFIISKIENIDERLPFYGCFYTRLTPVQLSARFGLDPLLDFVLSRTPDLLARVYFNENVLHLVCECENSLDNARKLLEEGADIEAKDFSGITPLMKAGLYDRLDLVTLFIEYGADLEAIDQNGQTAILKAIYFRNFDFFELLLKRGASLNVVDNRMNSALHLMFTKFIDNNNKKLCEAILKLGLDPNRGNENNYTPLHVLADNPLLRWKVKYAAMLVKCGASLNELTDEGDSVLHICARHSNIKENMDLLIYLINQGADVTVTNNSNENFLIIESDDILKKLVVEEKNRKFNFSNELQQLIESDWVLLYYQSSYRTEVALLDHLKIDESSYLSFFDVFLLDNKKLARICRNELIAAAIKNFRISDFPAYGNDIKSKFENALILVEAETSISNYLNEGTALNSHEISDVLDAL